MPLSSPTPQSAQFSSLEFEYFFTMEFPSGQSQKRELQGPRPTPLKVRKDSHKIRKPPVPVPPPQQQPSQPQAPPPRPPVIIYTVSPKVIHANPSEFMTLVQRLTGPDQSTRSSSIATSSASSAFHDSGSAISPAARFASIEKIRSPEGKKKNLYQNDVAAMEGLEISTGFFPGILSPNPASLPPIPPNFFSPLASDQNPLGFFYDLSPVLHSNKNYLETSFYMPSPSSLDLFNNFFDL